VTNARRATALRSRPRAETEVRGMLAGDVPGTVGLQGPRYPVAV